jgi:iron complex transport system permease protein
VPALTGRRLAASLAILFALLALGVAVCASVGSSGYTLLDLSRPVADTPGGGLPPGGEPDMARVIILRVRLPRVLLAVLAGAALGAAGTVFQGVLRNPLADPYVLGISGGAALGFIAASAAGLHSLLPSLPARQAAAFAGAAATVAFIFLLSRVHGRIASYPMLLIGVVLNTLYLAVILLIQTVVGASRLHGVMLWMVGNVPVEGYPTIATLAIVLVPVILSVAFLGRDLNLLAAGEDAARSLGVEVERSRVVALVLASLATAAVVSVTGLVGFVGLIVPHAARLLFGPDHRLLIPASALAGALFLLVADTAARTVLAPTEIPVGVLTALCGGPFFIWLYRFQRGAAYSD